MPQSSNCRFDWPFEPVLFSSFPFHQINILVILREPQRVKLASLTYQVANLRDPTAKKTSINCPQAGDDGTKNLLVSDVIRTNELQVWFLSENLVDVPLVKACAPAKTKAASGE